MRALVSILLLAAARVEMVDEVYQIPASEWRYVPLGLKQQPALVSAHFKTEKGSDRVRLALLRRDDLERLRAGVPHGVIQVTPEAPQGDLDYQVRAPGDYVIVIDNQARAPAAVHVRIWLDFSRRGPAVTQLPPQRQLTVIVISFAVFFAIVSYSARRLLRVVRRG